MGITGRVDEGGVWLTERRMYERSIVGIRTCGLVINTDHHDECRLWWSVD